MIHLLLLVLCVTSVELFVLLGLRHDIVAMISVSREAVGILTSSRLADLEKEVLLRRKSLELFRLTAVFSSKFLLICLFACLIYASVVGLSPEAGKTLLENLVSLDGLALLTAVMMCYVWARNAIRKRLQIR